MIKIKQAELLAMAAKEEQYPFAGPPEVAFAGRSNVGKSSLLNLLTVRKKLAYTSGSPGKTQTINFYAINGDAFRIVDLPGYGYAKVPNRISQKWGKMIEHYLENRNTLRRVAMLVDIRHAPSVQDVQLYDYLKYYELSGLIVATKSDKISRNDLQKQIKLIRKTLKSNDEDKIVCVSALNKTGAPELLGEIEKIIRE